MLDIFESYPTFLVFVAIVVAIAVTFVVSVASTLVMGFEDVPESKL